jgi:protein SCO1/2
MSKKVFWTVTAVIGMLVVATLALSLMKKTASFRGVVYDPLSLAPEINLTDQNGQPFQLNALRNKVVLLYFGYTSCPDVCPTTLADLRQTRSLLKDQAQDVQVVFITVDPDRDTPERIQDYVSAFDPSFLGLSGSLTDLEPIYQSYGVSREIDKTQNTAAGYLVIHSSRVYLVDPQGNLRLSYSFGASPVDIAHDIQMLLKE